MTAGWRAAVLQQLRQVRRRLPKFSEDVPEDARKEVHKKLLDAELAAEHVAHRLILGRLKDEVLPTEGGSAKERVEKSLKIYLRRLAPSQDERDLADIGAVVAAL
jgi:hypothetical protein